MKLGLRIGLAFFVVLALLSMVLGISVFALQTMEKGNDSYRKLSYQTFAAGELQANMLKVRIHAVNFIFTKSDYDLAEYHEYFTNMNTFLDQTKIDFKKPERVVLMKSVDNLTASYDIAFLKVVALIREADRVYVNELLPHGEEMSDIIAEIIDEALVKGDIDAREYANTVQNEMFEARLFIMDFLDSNTETDYDIGMQKVEGELKQSIMHLDDTLVNSEQRVKFDQFVTTYTEYITDIHQIHAITSEINDILKNSLVQISTKLENDLDDMVTSLMSDMDALGAELKIKTKKSIKMDLLFAFMALIIGTVAAYLLTISITRPINRAVKAANKLAAGDLTIQFSETSQDETGLLLNSIQNTAQKLREMITIISSSSTELAYASEELATVTEQNSKGIAQQENETELVATAMYEMTATVRDVADNAAKAADAASQADDKARFGRSVVEKTIAAINTLTESVNDSSEKLSGVELEVVNISSILDVIRGIADQTNLLALNAAIEAARAGEQGRGFAVVADEVRSLASRTQNSTQEIQQIIEKLQEGTKNTVTEMSHGKQQAVLCVEQANETYKALEDITESISMINDMNFQIASASEEQSSVSEGINENVVNVKRIAGENTLATNQTKASSIEIAQLAEKLKQLAAQFKV